MTKFKPAFKRILIKRDDPIKATASGLLLPDSNDKPARGKVMATWSETAGDFKAGDDVVFGQWTGQEIVLDGEKLLVMKEEDILGKVTGDIHIAAASAA